MKMKRALELICLYSLILLLISFFSLQFVARPSAKENRYRESELSADWARANDLAEARDSKLVTLENAVACTGIIFLASGIGLLVLNRFRPMPALSE